MLVSGCVITERVAPKAIKSLAQVSDEIVVIVTGDKNKDGLDYAESAKGRIPVRYFSRAWEKSFSVARNHAIKNAHGDWIFFVDTDEELVFDDPKGGPGRLRSLLHATKHFAFYIPLWNLRKDMEPVRGKIPRLFRKTREACFTKRVQNRLSGSGTITTMRDLRIEHTGYMDAEAMRVKEESRRELYELELEADPQDAVMWYHYAKNRYACMDIPGTIKAGERAMELLLKQGMIHNQASCVDIYSVLARAKLAVADFAGARRILSGRKHGCLNLVPRYFDAWKVLETIARVEADYARKVWEEEVALYKEADVLPAWDVISVKEG